MSPNDAGIPDGKHSMTSEGRLVFPVSWAGAFLASTIALAASGDPAPGA